MTATPTTGSNQPFLLSPEEALAQAGVDAKAGLSSAEVTERRAKYGPNKFAEGEKEPGWQVFVYAISIGAAMGAQRPLLSTILPRWYGLGHIGAIQGVTAFLGVAASATGPVALSLVSEQLGGYGTAAMLLATIPVFIAVASLGISEPAPRVARPVPPPAPAPPD